MIKKLLLCCCFVLCCGCSQTQQYDYPSSYMVDQENMFDYQSRFECAAYASAYVLRHYGIDALGLPLFEDMPDKLEDDNGTYPSGIIKLFDSHGFEASLQEDASIDDLKQEISKGAPVIVYIHVDVDTPSLHYTHYVPIIGYDESYFYFAESLEDKANCKDENLPYNRKTDIATFEKLWTNIDGYYEHPYVQIRKAP